MVPSIVFHVWFRNDDMSLWVYGGPQIGSLCVWYLICCNLVSVMGWFNMMLSTCSLISSPRPLSAVSISSILNNASSVAIFLPGTYTHSGLKCIKSMGICWHLTGASSSCLVFINGTSGLWSVFNRKLSKQTKYLENFSHAHITARHSFSIWANFLSVLVFKKH